MDAKLLLALFVLTFSSGIFATNTVRDPFTTLSNAPAPPQVQPLIRAPSKALYQSPQLKGILWGDRPLANINGMIVASGDKVYDYTVDQIGRTTAVLRRADKTILLVLKEDR